MRDQRTVYEKLQALARSDGPPAERESAELAMKRLEEIYGKDLVMPTVVPQGRIYLRYLVWPTEHDLIISLARYLELKSYYAFGPGGGRTKEIRVEGDKPLLAVLEDLYTFHRKKLNALLSLLASGYIQGAAPNTNRDTDKEVKRDPLTDDERAALLLGYRIGKDTERPVHPRLETG